MAKEKPGKLVNRADLATVFGVSLPTIDAWVGKQMPVVQRGAKGKEWSFDTAACIRWRVADGIAEAMGEENPDDNSLDSQIKRVELETKRLKYAAAAKLVVPVEQLRHALVALFAVVRAGMRNVPARCVSQVIGSASESHIRGVLEREVDSALSAVAAFDISKFVESADEGDEDEVEEVPESE